MSSTLRPNPVLPPGVNDIKGENYTIKGTRLTHFEERDGDRIFDAVSRFGLIGVAHCSGATCRHQDFKRLQCAAVETALQ